ncbi:MAG: metallophosphoesterase family protein [Ilumatobacteraceae bacterium]
MSVGHYGPMVEEARIVQLTDTHLSAALGVPPQWPATDAWLRLDPPDLIVHSGDIVLEDPDDAADRAFAGHLLADLPAPLRCVPGNHDVGAYGDDERRPERLAAFRQQWGHDRFSVDLAGWRVVGVDVYLFGEVEHDEWLRAVTDVPFPVLVVAHQPLCGDPVDGWEMPPEARAAFEAATSGADVRVVASGHRHVSGQLGRAVWAPSLTQRGFVTSGSLRPGFDPRPGLVEHTIGVGGRHDWRVVRPWDEPVRSARPAGR